MHFTQGMTPCPQFRCASGRTSISASARGDERVAGSDAGLRLFIISLDINWPHVITSDDNKPLCGGNVVAAGRISGAFNELADCHFELGLTLEAEKGGMVLASHLPERIANTVDISRPLMDEDVLLFAGVVGFLDESSYDHVVAVSYRNVTLRVVHVQLV